MPSFVRCSILSLMLLLPGAAAVAGPPFATDDPEPTEFRQFEIYLFSEGEIEHGQAGGTAAALEVNSGAYPDLQLSFSLPLGFSAP
ncbi:MAG TPA: hypothetical protein VG798_05555, partial [Rhizomicrobium sp.]|nr:hypothetical protein [Rhizomicrobium sp.]